MNLSILLYLELYTAVEYTVQNTDIPERIVLRDFCIPFCILSSKTLRNTCSRGVWQNALSFALWSVLIVMDDIYHSTECMHIEFITQQCWTHMQVKHRILNMLRCREDPCSFTGRGNLPPRMFVYLLLHGWKLINENDMTELYSPSRSCSFIIRLFLLH